MTCIVAVAEEGIVTIGGDSAGSSGPFTRLRADAKVFRKDNFVMGFTSSFRMGQLLRYSLSVADRPRSMDGEEYMSTWFVSAVRTCLKNGGYARVNEGVEEGGTFLVGYEGRIYGVHDDYQVGCPVEPYEAVGCGVYHALGALRVMEPQKLSAPSRVRKALDVAAFFSNTVSPPYTVLATKEADA